MDRIIAQAQAEREQLHSKLQAFRVSRPGLGLDPAAAPPLAGAREGGGGGGGVDDNLRASIVLDVSKLEVVALHETARTTASARRRGLGLASLRRA